MDGRTLRSYATKALTIATGTAITTEAVDARHFASGSFSTPATLNATTVIGFMVCDTENGTFVNLAGSTNVLTQVTVKLDGSRSYEIPDAVFKHAFFKLATQVVTTGAAVNQTGAKAFTVTMKS